MNTITQLVILTLSLLLVNAIQVQYCTNLLKNFKRNCSPSMFIIKNCCELNELHTLKPDHAPSGVYKMRKGTFDSSANVYCDMTTNGGGWIVITRNKKGSTVDFNKNWTDYEEGFGDLKTEFWYGLEVIHCLTQTGQWEMRVDYQKNDKTWSYLHYNQFSVGSASEEYPLTVGVFTGEGTDRFAYHNGYKFSTPDNGNDNYSCAASNKSGWWYRQCRHISTNTQPPYVYGHVLFTEMKIRPKSCITH
ncbi:fibrinogen-like protein A [Dysidea avara]|uniref:fibrinogen-like protein A n=1 Tax=Dysidea avara TaxID=196820 RepID=UPI00331E428E